MTYLHKVLEYSKYFYNYVWQLLLLPPFYRLEKHTGQMMPGAMVGKQQNWDPNPDLLSHAQWSVHHTTAISMLYKLYHKIQESSEVDKNPLK